MSQSSKVSVGPQFGAWRGHNWTQHVGNDVLRVWTTSDGEAATAEHAMQRIEKCVDKVTEYLDWLRSPTVDVAVFPLDSYFESVELDPVRLSWVSGCVREAVYCGRPGMLEFDNTASDIGTTHEVVHCLLNDGFDERPAALCEGIAEAVARFGVEWPEAEDESTRFYRSLSFDELPTLAECDAEGLMGRSAERPATNISYASAALFIVGVAQAMKVDINRAVGKIVELNYSVSAVADELSTPVAELLDGHRLQRLGMDSLDLTD